MQTFDDGIRLVAGKILFGVPNLTDAERAFVYDVRRRDDVRYEFKSLKQLIALSRRCRRREDREALAEFIRGEILAGDPECTMEIPLVFNDETAATSNADPIQRQLEQHPQCRTTWQRCVDAMLRQFVATRRTLDRLHAMPKAWT